MRKSKRYLLQSMQRAYDAFYYEDQDRGWLEKKYDIWHFDGRYDVNEHCPLLKTKTQHRYTLRKNPEVKAVVEFDIRGQQRGFRIFTVGYDPLIGWALDHINYHW